MMMKFGLQFPCRLGRPMVMNHEFHPLAMKGVGDTSANTASPPRDQSHLVFKGFAVRSHPWAHLTAVTMV